jgi:hypothetical protein
VVLIVMPEFSTRITETMKGSGLIPFVLYDNNWLFVHQPIVDWPPAPVAGKMAFAWGQDVAFLPSMDFLWKEKLACFAKLRIF